MSGRSLHGHEPLATGKKIETRGMTYRLADGKIVEDYPIESLDPTPELAAR